MYTERDSLLQTLNKARQYLAILEEQAAGYGSLSVPAHLVIEINDKKRQITELEQRLKQLPQNLPSYEVPYQYNQPNPTNAVSRTTPGVDLVAPTILIGLIIGLIQIPEPILRAVLIVAATLLYGTGYLLIKRPAQLPISGKLSASLTTGLVVALLLLCFAAVILGLGWVALALLGGWQVAMIITTGAARVLPVGNAALKVMMISLAATSLGSGVGIAAPPVAGFTIAALSGPQDLVIANTCATPLILQNGENTLTIAKNQQQNVAVPPAAIRLKQDQGKIFVQFATLDTLVEFPDRVSIKYDSTNLALGNQWSEIRLWELKERKLIVSCG